LILWTRSKSNSCCIPIKSGLRWITTKMFICRNNCLWSQARDLWPCHLTVGLSVSRVTFWKSSRPPIKKSVLRSGKWLGFIIAFGANKNQLGDVVCSTFWHIPARRLPTFVSPKDETAGARMREGGGSLWGLWNPQCCPVTHDNIPSRIRIVVSHLFQKPNHQIRYLTASPKTILSSQRAWILSSSTIICTIFPKLARKSTSLGSWGESSYY